MGRVPATRSKLSSSSSKRSFRGVDSAPGKSLEGGAASSRRRNAEQESFCPAARLAFAAVAEDPTSTLIIDIQDPTGKSRDMSKSTLARFTEQERKRAFPDQDRTRTFLDEEVAGCQEAEVGTHVRRLESKRSGACTGGGGAGEEAEKDDASVSSPAV
ncbi:hypothetical protein KM043_006558 [Ampulex compressa]|nr:hypothetical protein KM043_006558 [Ampulex compressa]